MKILMACTNSTRRLPITKGIACRTTRKHGMPIDSPKARLFTHAGFNRFTHIRVADRNNYHHFSPPVEHSRRKSGYMPDTLPENPGIEPPDTCYGYNSDSERTPCPAAHHLASEIRQ